MKRQCYNPYLPSWEYIPDAEPKVFGQRLYIYGSHDLFGAKEYCEGDYVCWSTPVEDLSDWRYEGVIFKKQDTPWNKENLSYYAGCGARHRRTVLPLLFGGQYVDHIGRCV